MRAPIIRHWTGCRSDAECEATLSDTVCREAFAGLDTCIPACASAAECDLGVGALYDEDNYQCEAGGCVWQGCLSDNECAMTNGAGERCVSR